MGSKSWQAVAVDLGASNGRTVLGRFDGARLELKETRRFANGPVQVFNTLYWDAYRLYDEIVTGLSASMAAGQETGGRPESIGIDGWGVDFSLIDAGGHLLDCPMHYRNSCFAAMPEQVYRTVSSRALHRATGIETMQINTIFQLMYMKLHRPELLERAERLLLFPDLMNYWLTGVQACEFTHATTTQLFDPYRRAWALELIGKLGLPEHLFLPVTMAGHALGPLHMSLQGRLPNTERLRVVQVGQHDTASALFAVGKDASAVYVASGTWMLIGVGVATPLVNEQTEKYGFTNEGAVAGDFHLQKNMTGLWLLQELLRCSRAYGIAATDYESLMRMAERAKPLIAVIDPDATPFLSPADMATAIREYLAATGQTEEEGVLEFGNLARIALEGIALKTRWVVERLESLTGRTFTKIRIVGGGVQNRLLCQWLADCTDKPVVAGPVEAAVIGNLAAQLTVAGELSGTDEVAQLTERSFPFTTFDPDRTRTGQWNEAYGKLKERLQADEKAR